MLTQQVDFYVEYLKIKAKSTRDSNAQTRQIEALQNELATLRVQHRKEVGKLRMEIIQLKRDEMVNFDTEYLIDSKRMIFKVAEFVGCTYEDLIGKWRIREVVIARHILFYYFRYEMGMKLKQIGVLFGRDHATVINGIKNVEAFIANPKYYKQENILIDKIYGK
jgi:chromosomal replication initiation ATPase DnaA